MTYIILDLEWDSTYFAQKKQFINQIIQIGAVKLDESFNIADTFEITVKSGISKKLSGRFSKLTGITTEQMLSGTPLEKAVELFNEWTGKDTVTMTWSDSDLYSIKKNEEMLLNNRVKFSIENYLDLQKYVQGEIRIMGQPLKNQISLSAAAEFFGIKTEEFELHTAKEDSVISALLLKKCYNKDRFSSYIVNAHDGEFERRLTFKSYAISNLSDKSVDKSKLLFNCDKCGSSAKRINGWKYRNRWFGAKFYCKECGRRFLARVSFTQKFDKVTVKRRICELNPKTTLTEQKNDLQPVPEKV